MVMEVLLGSSPRKVLKLSKYALLPALEIITLTEKRQDVTNTEKTWTANMVSTSTLQSPPRLGREQSSSSDDSSPAAKARLVKVGNLGGSRSKNLPVSRHPERYRRNS